MKHYGIGRWVDFTRHLTAEGEAAAMRTHLISGCAECGEMSIFFDRFSGICRDLAAVGVPDSVLQRAMAIFPLRAPKSTKRAFRIPVELIYDSFLTPAPAGLRSSWQVGWQGLYRAGECSLDLRIEPELHTPRASVIGQVSDHRSPEHNLAGLPVCLKSGRVVVAETRSNGFGEFQMEYQQQKRLQLLVHLDGGERVIQVALKSVGSETTRSNQ